MIVPEQTKIEFEDYYDKVIMGNTFYGSLELEKFITLMVENFGGCYDNQGVDVLKFLLEHESWFKETNSSIIYYENCFPTITDKFNQDGNYEALSAFIKMKQDEKSYFDKIEEAVTPARLYVVDQIAQMGLTRKKQLSRESRPYKFLFYSRKEYDEFIDNDLSKKLILSK